MDEISFWSLIEQTSSTDQARQANSLRAELARAPLPEIVSFEDELQKRITSANIGDLWAAAMLMNGGSCSDDCFLYFRYWLVAQGESIYGRAIQSPDTLADVVASMGADRPEDFQFEEFGYVAARAYEDANSGKPLRRRRSHRAAASEEFDWREYTNEVLRVRLPKLWRLFGAKKVANDQSRDERVKRALNNLSKIDLPGVGTIEVGSKVVHKNLGMGTVKGLAGGLVVTAVIAFPDGDRSIVLIGDVIKAVVR